MSKFLVTGGGGFLGKSICKALKQAGHQVVSVARGAYPELEKYGIEHYRIDLSKDLDKLEKVMAGCEAVFHVAAKVDMWGKYQDFFEGNVLATRNVITACHKNKITKLIFTSSPSVIADGKDLLAADESYPYPATYSAFYPKTKAQAEQEVLNENGKNGLMTIALRPHLIWGKEDTNLIPTILEKAKAGKLLRVGNGENLTDLTYIDDCVEAHLLALRALEANPAARGKAYFITQSDPVNMWDWIDRILQIHGLPKIEKKISKKLATILASVLEFVSNILPGKPEPLLTKFLVCEMSTSHYFNISAAKRDLGYYPSMTIDQAMQKCFAENSKAA